MALSNWATAAVDEKGQPSNGLFTSVLGVTVEIYKNWLYVHDPAAWREGGPYVHPVVMSINAGEVSYQDVRVLAVRGPKEGVYAIVWSGYESDPDFRAMIGIGCYGYEGRVWRGIERSDIAHLETLFHENGPFSSFDGSLACHPGLLDGAFNQGARFIIEALTRSALR